MFETASNLKVLHDTLSSNMELPEYFLGIHAFFDGEVIFARDVVQVNAELSPFPVDFENVWDWLREQLKGPPAQEAYVYELTFKVEDEEDPVMEALVEITQGSPSTIWMIDLANQQTPDEGQRFIVVTLPDKRLAKEFREHFHGKEFVLASSR